MLKLKLKGSPETSSKSVKQVPGIVNECWPGIDQVTKRWLISDAVGNSHRETWLTWDITGKCIWLRICLLRISKSLHLKHMAPKGNLLFMYMYNKFSHPACLEISLYFIYYIIDQHRCFSPVCRIAWQLVLCPIFRNKENYCQNIRTTSS